MKQLFLFMLAACFAVFTFAQQTQSFKVNVQTSNSLNHVEEGMSQSTNGNGIIPTPDIDAGAPAGGEIALTGFKLLDTVTAGQVARVRFKL